MAEQNITIEEPYGDLHPAEAWRRICNATGVKSRVEKTGSDFDWTDFALNCEATIGLLMNERANWYRLFQKHGIDPLAAPEKTNNG